jgi:signal transduction histidine kinase
MVDKTVNAVDIDGLPDALRDEWRARSIRADAAAAHTQALVVRADSVLAGAGLGLAICKSIVEAQGGSIWVASVVGRGTTMHFTLRAVPHEVATERGSP